MRILFLGSSVPRDRAEALSGASVAGNNMQLEFLHALTRIPGVEVDVCSLLPVATYPREKSLWVTSGNLRIGAGLTAHQVPFTTLPLLKQFSQILFLARAGSKLAHRRHYDFVLAFNMYPHIGFAAWWLKWRRRTRIACLLADVPVPWRSTRNPMKSALLSMYNSATRLLLRQVDATVALTSRAAAVYTPQAAAIAIDGAINHVQCTVPIDPLETSGEEEKKVVFAGTLTQYNGIDNLLKAMQWVEDTSVVLHVYGGGALADVVSRVARSSSNIVYHGKVSSAAMAAVQQEAFLLINPRPIANPVSDVAFPSKVLEYMASGTPVLSTRLPCFSSEYDELLFFAETGTPAELGQLIDKIASLSGAERQGRGARAREFVHEHRTWDSVAARTVALLRTVQ